MNNENDNDNENSNENSNEIIIINEIIMKKMKWSEEENDEETVIEWNNEEWKKRSNEIMKKNDMK